MSRMQSNKKNGWRGVSASETIWPIARRWEVWTASNDPELIDSSGLSQFQAFAVLGVAGTGKTYAFKELAKADRKNGFDVQEMRLVSLGSSVDGLESKLNKLAENVASNSVVYLDALDEVMIPVRTASLIIENWIRERLALKKPVFRISCRSAVWPKSIETALGDVYGEENTATAILQPLSTEEILKIAVSEGIDASAFHHAVEQARVFSMAQLPLALKMLLQLYPQKDTLPEKRSKLFAQGVSRLASEPTERLSIGTVEDFTTKDLIDAAERLACFMLLSGKESIDLSDEPDPSSLSRIDLEQLAAANGRRLDFKLLRALSKCGLCASDGTEQFRFVHRQFAEYLAGRRLAVLPLHQSKSLLSTSLGWEKGVAIPLRETAAFAALHSKEIANWVAFQSPEVIGLSDVADDELRKQATFSLLEKCRRQELTDVQFVRNEIELKGFQYPGAEADLRSVLQEKGVECHTVVECAIALIKTWRLSSMANDLADLMLDENAPLEARKAAGYALLDFKLPEVFRRLRPLIQDDKQDPKLDLKGLALRCIERTELSTTELLSAISTKNPEGYVGAYQSFLRMLKHSGFDASDCCIEGLKWAIQFQNKDSDFLHQAEIARRVAFASVSKLTEPGVVEAIIDLVLEAAKNYVQSPLVILPRYSDEYEESITPHLEASPELRRILVAELVSRELDFSLIWRIVHDTPNPNLVMVEDFPWLLKQAVSENLAADVRERYAEIAKILPWGNSVKCIEAWLEHRTKEPIATQFSGPIFMELGSAEAKKAKEGYLSRQRISSPARPTKLSPPPPQRVEEALTLCETQDVKYFFNLRRELTLNESSTTYGVTRFLTETPGWTAADARTRCRIVEAAKRLLLEDTEEPDAVRIAKWTSVAVNYMAAIWLVMSENRPFLLSLPKEWWERWCFYILRELHLGLASEYEQLAKKQDLLQLLYDCVPKAVRSSVSEWACNSDQDACHILSFLLEVLVPIKDDKLDEILCEHLVLGKISEKLSRDVARFVLLRSPVSSVKALTSALSNQNELKDEAKSAALCVALIEVEPSLAWPEVIKLLRGRPKFARRVLSDYVNHKGGLRLTVSSLVDDGWDFISIVELLQISFEAFPPEEDPSSHGAMFLGSEDLGWEFREQLLNWVCSQEDDRGVRSLQAMFEQYGSTYPSLRYYLASAKKNSFRSRWTPVLPRTVAQILAADSKRLIRSEHDALEGVVAAITGFVDRIRRTNPNDIEDFWNTPYNSPATPKHEERVSDKICNSIREYFQEFAVTVDREVQVFRRITPKAEGGAPGSKVDVFCSIPAAGTEHASRIVVPVEVKWSHNPEAKTGLKNQLFDRYMSETGAVCGVYVVAWTGNNASPKHQPVWHSIEEAEADLKNQAAELKGVHVRPIVIDLSLPTASMTKTKIK